MNPDLSLVQAGDDDKSTVARLIQLYLYDLSTETDFAIGEDGRYDYGYLDAFWEHPYLFRAAGHIAGFALVISHCPITQTAPCWFMAEFFVMRRYRRQSLGRSMLQAILARHPGSWHIATQTQNRGADAFWARAIPTEGRRELSAQFDDADWILRGFDQGNADLVR